MKRYTVETAPEGTRKYFYIMDCETLEIALLPSKYLKHKIKSNLSPNTVKRYAFSLLLSGIYGRKRMGLFYGV